MRDRGAADELFERTGARDAVYCLPGRHAAGVLARLRERGLAVPRDVPVVAGSDSEHTRAAGPPITSVDLRPELLVRVAVTMLVNRLDKLERAVPRGDIPRSPDRPRINPAAITEAVPNGIE